MEESSNQGVLAQIETLEEEGLSLGYGAKQLLHTKDVNTKLFDFYELWKINLLHLAEKCKNRDFEVAIKKPDGVTSEFFTELAFQEKVSRGPIRGGLANEDFSMIVMSEESIAQIHSMEAGINSRLEALSTLRKFFARNTDKLVTIYVETTDKRLYKIADGKKLVCSFSRGKKFALILKIIRSPKPMAAKKLSEKSNIQVVSTDVRRINTKIEANLLLDPKKKFIVNPDKRSGYRVNEVYEITIS